MPPAAGVSIIRAGCGCVTLRAPIAHARSNVAVPDQRPPRVVVNLHHWLNQANSLERPRPRILGRPLTQNSRVYRW
jgi:hypothetical protein